MTDEELVKQLRTASIQSDDMRMPSFGYLFKTAAESIEHLITFNDFWKDAANQRLDKIEAKLPKWISVSERLPKIGTNALVCFQNCDMAVACVFDTDEDLTFWRAVTDEGWTCDCDTEPTHWMPLPYPPHERKEE